VDTSNTNTHPQLYTAKCAWCGARTRPSSYAFASAWCETHAGGCPNASTEIWQTMPDELEQVAQRPDPWHDPAGWHRSIDEDLERESREAAHAAAEQLATEQGLRLDAVDVDEMFALVREQARITREDVPLEDRERWEARATAFWATMTARTTQAAHDEQIRAERAAERAHAALCARGDVHCQDWPLCGHDLHPDELKIGCDPRDREARWCDIVFGRDEGERIHTIMAAAHGGAGPCDRGEPCPFELRPREAAGGR
jgi:hypothetical protein